MHKCLLKDIYEKNIQVPIYIDRNSINKKICAAAVRPITIWITFLDFTNSFTVYAGKLYGIFLVTKIALETLFEPKIVIICMNNKAAIRAVSYPKSKPDKYIVPYIILAIDFIR